MRCWVDLVGEGLIEKLEFQVEVDKFNQLVVRDSQLTKKATKDTLLANKKVLIQIELARQFSQLMLISRGNLLEIQFLQIEGQSIYK